MVLKILASNEGSGRRNILLFAEDRSKTADLSSECSSNVLGSI